MRLMSGCGQILLVVAFLSSTLLGQAPSQPVKTLELDQPVPEFSLSRGESRTFLCRFPALSEEKVLAVDFSVRAQGAGLKSGEGRYYLDLRWNGSHVQALAHRLHPFLRNKPSTDHGQSWFLKGVGWRVKHADSFPEAVDESLRDVIELAPVSSGENLLSFTNMPQHDVVPKLFFKDVTLRLVPAQGLRKGFQVAGDELPVIALDSYGGISVQAGNVTIPVATSLSRPGGGYWQVGKPSDSVRPVEFLKMKPLDVTSQDRLSVQFESETVRWVRKFERQGQSLVGRDELTNLTDTDQGFQWRQEFLFPAPVESVSLAGDDDPSTLQTRLAANPSVFVPLGSLGVGMIATDDVLRTQAIEAYDPAAGRLSLRTDRLMIPAKQTATLWWSMYALPRADYFDFINQIRSDWKVGGFRIDGPYWWDAQNGIPQSDAQLQAWLKTNPPAAAVIGSWVDYQKKRPHTVGLGTGVFSPEFDNYRDRLAKYIERLHRLKPGLKVLVYEHPFYNWPEQKPGEFRDSWITQANGDRFFLPATSSDSQAAGVFPTQDNQFGEAFRQTLVDLRKALKVDGFYLDETTHPGRLSDPLTYGTQDNVTAILDPQTFAIRTKVGHLSLLSGGYLEQLVTQLQQADLLVLGNFAPAIMSQSRGNWPRFVETDNLKGCPAAHLYSPLAFSYSFERYTIDQVRDRLMQGLLWCVTGPKDQIGIPTHFFPITPEELHAGWVKGKERIVTAVSGDYGWENDDVGVRVWSYDRQGKLLNSEPEWQLFRGKEKVEVPAGGISILERR